MPPIDSGIDGATGNATPALVSNVKKQGANKYERRLRPSFQARFRLPEGSNLSLGSSLVVDHAAKTGSVVFQNVTLAYQLVDLGG